MTSISFNLETEPAYEAGARLLTVLAWPDMIEDDNAMNKRHACLCQGFLKALPAVDPDWLNSQQNVKPAYLTRHPDEVERLWREYERRLRARMVAARMAIPFLREAEGIPPGLPAGIRRLSLNEMGQLVLSGTDEGETANLETRIWQPSRPVIHIAAALAVAIDVAEKKGEVLTDTDLFARPDIIRWVVITSEHYAELRGCTGIDVQRLAGGVEWPGEV